MPQEHLLSVKVLPRLESSPLRLAYDDFLLSREVMRCTPKTMEHYRYSAGGFVAWLEARHIEQPTQIKATHIRAYLADVAAKGVKDTTLHVHARGVKTLIRFWNAEGYISQAIPVQMPRLDTKRLPCLDAEGLRKLVNACEQPRDRALVLLMVDTGLRLAEVSALTWNDVDVKSGLVRVVRGKGGKARSVVVGATARRALLAYRRWLAQAYEKEPQPGKALWLNLRSGEPLKPKGIAEVLKHLGKKAGVLANPHSLRRTFATLSLRAGMSPLHLQGLLGHSTLEMTRRYVQMVSDDLQQAHKEHGPIDRWL